MMRALIVGGGIGGIAAAIALRQAGADPLVLEQAPALAPVGAGINLGANAMKALVALGAADHVRNTGVKGEQELYLDLLTGEHIARRQLLGAAAAERYGEVYHSLHRADLLDALLQQLPDEHIRLDCHVAAVEESPGGVTAYLTNGERVDGDVLIGADGLKSRVRAILFGDEEAKFMGTQGWRATFPRTSLPSHLPPSEGLSAWIGPGRAASMYPIRRDLMYGGAFVPADEVHEESWTSEGGIDELRAAFNGACADVHRFIDAIEETAETLFLTSIYYRDPLERWSTARMTLLGDAAHPGPPAAGQGSAMAMEDAVMLGACVKRHGADIASAFSEYEQRRIPRTTRVVETALAIQRFLAVSDPVQIRARNGRLRGLARLDPLGETTFGWMMRHDVRDAINEPIEQAAGLTRRPNPMRRPEARRAFDVWRHALTTQDRASGWVQERLAFDRALLAVSSAVDAPVERVDVDGVPALLVGDGDGPAVLHLHGGGYTMGSPASALPLASRIARALGGPVLVPDYRLGPEHPFPAAVEDAVLAYRWLAERVGVDRAPVLSGECAGGGLAVATAMLIRDGGLPAPEAIWAVSPFVDLTLTATSIDEAVGRDGWFDRISLTTAAVSYLHDHDPTDPLASPLHGDLRGLPPIRIHVARDEALIDDARSLAAAAQQAGVRVQLTIVDDSVHSFVLFDFLPEAEDALREVAAFVAEHGAGAGALIGADSPKAGPRRQKTAGGETS